MANMFRCTLASGGGALILTVTCDSAFAGQTITCTDGTTTLTQICPSTSPYTVEFRIPNSGTWTISSGTDSTSVVIPDAIELHYIPNGSTITPTDDIQTWLHCANIWDKSYTTITQVLNDASTLQALIASNNAADYMARSTTWASSVTANASAMTYIGLNDYCAETLLSNSTWLNAICNSSYFESILNVKVPTMTSDTTPSGVAKTSSYAFDANKAYTAFTTNGQWISSYRTSNQWVQYQFTQQVKVYCMDFRNFSDGNNGKSSNIELYQSDNESNMQLLKSFSGLSTSTIHRLIVDNSDFKLIYRVKVLGQNNTYSGGTCRASAINFYGRAQS